MRRLWLPWFALFATLAVGLAQADEPRSPADEQAEAFRTLKLEYDAANKAFFEKIKAVAAATAKEGKTPQPIRLEDGPGPAFSPRFLSLAERAPEGSVALDALLMALQTGYVQDGTQSPTWGRAIALLRDHYRARPEIAKAVRTLASYDEDPAAHALLRDIIDHHPDRKIQAQTTQTLAETLDSSARLNGLIGTNPELRARAEKLWGKARLEKHLAQGERQGKERDLLNKLLEDRYGDIIPNLAIGQPAPALAGEDLDGKPARLADLKGKVVVLDVWATWCGPCRAMIPHERTLVEKLKGKPFALISISADDEKETLVKFLAKEPMPWTHWWNGSEGKLLEALNIRHFPTIFVLDAKGLIRFKEVRGEALEKAVEQLLAELDAQSTE